MSKKSKGHTRIGYAGQVALAMGTMLPMAAAMAQAVSDAPAGAAQSAPLPPASQANTVDSIIVNGIRKGDLILPTTVNSNSAFGLDLGVLDTPRSNTVLSRVQLEALNVQNPQEFSYLTSSSYADSSFGLPNIPRIRGQYGDVFFNGMRDSFSSNGYGAPLSFNSFDTMDIVKGPASVQAGPGAGVGGSINISTKMPNFSAFGGTATVEFDSEHQKRQTFDIGGPAGENLAWRISYAGEESGSYYDYMYFHQQALYGVVVANITDKYTIQFNSEIVDGRYTENDGVNRVTQQLIDSGTYLTGGPIGSGPIQGFLQPISLGNTIQLNRHTDVDGAPGTGAHSIRYNAQLIQTYEFSPTSSVVNNTFFNYINRYNTTGMYWADSAMGTYTIENKTDFKFKVNTPMGDKDKGWTLKQDIDAGFTFRLAHTDEIQNFANEPVSIFDLGNNPTTLSFPASSQAAGGALPYTGAFGAQLYGVSARNGYYLNSTIDSNLYDIAAFIEHRFEFSPEFSLMYGLRGDVVQAYESDPLPDPNWQEYPQSIKTAAYLLRNGNVSPVYKPVPWASTYLTANFAQYVDPNSQDGGVGTYGQNPSSVLRQDTKLFEAGLKLDLLHKSLFWGADVFKQTRAIPTGVGGTVPDVAHITGFETELNYQPNPTLFATASYSYVSTKLDLPANFYNFPAQPGLNVDGSGLLAVWAPGSNYNDPGVPRQLANFLVNYKIGNGFGVQLNAKFMSSIQTTTSGQFNVAASQANGAVLPASVINSGGYYTSPTIPSQYTANGSISYDISKQYMVKFSVSNLTNQRNIYNDVPFYGNDFITVGTPRSYGIMFKAKL